MTIEHISGHDEEAENILSPRIGIPLRWWRAHIANRLSEQLGESVDFSDIPQALGSPEIRNKLGEEKLNELRAWANRRLDLALPHDKLQTPRNAPF